MKKVAIIGAGAAGLTASVILAREGVQVELFEQNSKNAKKILVSGNGHCNISNKNIDVSNYISDNPQFAEYALKRFGFKELEKFMNSLGLLLFCKEDGKCYPLSYEAKSVLSAFEETLANLDVKIFNGHRVESITKDKCFTLTCNDNEKRYGGYDALIVASGLKAAPQLGGNDDGLKFARSLGHTISEPYPSLVGLHSDSEHNGMLSGVKVRGRICVYVDRFKEKSIKGDILFTAYGISGLAVLDISQTASKALLNHQEVELSLDLISEFNPQSLSAQLLQLCKKVPQHSVLSLLSGIIPSKLAAVVLKEMKIQESMQALHLNTKMIKGIMNKLQNYRLRIIDTHGYKHAEVCGGGVNTNEIDAKSFESKKVKDLYFIGEVLDVTGERGGYNFQFAFASAHQCAKAVLNGFS
ncbi:NAD(P)/FAD-dependent oxidoreductase [Sulfurimonas sp. HSL-1716]|uniref:NAD(P)/FAD-dependent oxidoreductase n=1 Tax=Hydrocurvibacter sulfurireducens TaxID=3131937 RepID=UPI0031FA3FAC